MLPDRCCSRIEKCQEGRGRVVGPLFALPVQYSRSAPFRIIGPSAAKPYRRPSSPSSCIDYLQAINTSPFHSFTLLLAKRLAGGGAMANTRLLLSQSYQHSPRDSKVFSEGIILLSLACLDHVAGHLSLRITQSVSGVACSWENGTDIDEF